MLLSLLLQQKFFVCLFKYLAVLNKYLNIWLNIGASQVALVVKNLPTDVGNSSLILGSERSSGGGHGKALQYSWLENPSQEEPGGLQSMESRRAGHNWATEHTWVFIAARGLSRPVACGILSCLTRDGACVPCSGRQTLNHWTTRKSHKEFFPLLASWVPGSQF